MSRTIRLSLGLLLMTGSAAVGLAAPQTAPSRPDSKNSEIVVSAALQKKVASAMKRALVYQEKKQAKDGGWPGPAGRSDPAISALVVLTFIQHPDYGPSHPVVKQAIRLILSYRQKDGGFYDPQFGYGNYSTSVVLMALAAMKVPDMQEHIHAAQKWLKDNQWAEGKCDEQGKPIDPGHPWYGGAGYGTHRRPDLSNTQMMLQALHDSGLPPGDPAFQRAIRFIQRSQMLEQTNDQPFAQGTDDGGFIYTPANGGQSMAGEVVLDGKRRLRSYGSMTYAGFKSMIYARVDRDDLRVQRAWSWIRRYYTLAENPNMPGAQSKDGLFYYYHVFAKALQAWGEPVVVDAKGAKHDWRAELCDHLLGSQRPDGSWVNTAARWQEDDPCLVTAYAVLSLQTAIR